MVLTREAFDAQYLQPIIESHSPYVLAGKPQGSQEAPASSSVEPKGTPADIRMDDEMELAVNSLCKTDSNPMFEALPIVHNERTRALVLAAKAVCAQCIVRPNCLVIALRSGQTDGVWGAMTADERAVLLAQRITSWQ